MSDTLQCMSEARHQLFFFLRLRSFAKRPLEIEPVVADEDVGISRRVGNRLRVGNRNLYFARKKALSRTKKREKDHNGNERVITICYLIIGN